MTSSRGWARRDVVAVVVAAVGAVGSGAGCRAVDCVTTADCALDFECTVEGVCLAAPQGDIRWISPEPGSRVDSIFDAVVEVSFRAPTASITIDRDILDAGEPCAPFVPTTVEVSGDLDQAIVQQVTIPGLRSLGPGFGLTATLNAVGARSSRAAFAGEPTGYQGARFELPEATVVNASTALSVPVSAVFDRAAFRALVSVEPIGAQPSPRQVVGGGVLALAEVRAPLARGPQIVWLDTEDDGGAHRCGLGISGDSPATTGLELGLFFEGADPGQLDLHVLVEEAGNDATCTFTDPGSACSAIYESRAPARAGDEVIRVNVVQGVVVVAVVPGAAGPSMTARVRISNNGVHVGWLGPFPLQPSLGEVWIAGRIILDGSSARLERIDRVEIGAPF